MFRRFFLGVLPIHIVQLLTAVLPNVGMTTWIRGYLMRPAFKSCGTNFKVASGVIFNHPERISLGDNVYIAHNCWLNGIGGLTIGSDVQFAPMTVVVTSKHKVENGRVVRGSEPSPVVIGSGVWLGSHVVVTDGVTIGDGCLVGANSVVTKNLPKGAFAGGVPARVLRIHTADNH
jgi:acetyltransferase-like isoleucine patch superfamily enzyme